MICMTYCVYIVFIFMSIVRCKCFFGTLSVSLSCCWCVICTQLLLKKIYDDDDNNNNDDDDNINYSSIMYPHPLCLE